MHAYRSVFVEVGSEPSWTRLHKEPPELELQNIANRMRGNNGAELNRVQNGSSPGLGMTQMYFWWALLGLKRVLPEFFDRQVVAQSGYLV
jgi:hypothetical protein